MSTLTNSNASIESKFGLKREYADLQARSTQGFVNLATLESARLSGSGLTASKNGLEAICGASCETGAQ